MLAKIRPSTPDVASKPAAARRGYKITAAVWFIVWILVTSANGSAPATARLSGGINLIGSPLAQAMRLGAEGCHSCAAGTYMVGCEPGSLRIGVVSLTTPTTSRHSSFGLAAPGEYAEIILPMG